MWASPRSSTNRLCDLREVTRVLGSEDSTKSCLQSAWHTGGSVEGSWGSPFRNHDNHCGVGTRPRGSSKAHMAGPGPWLGRFIVPPHEPHPASNLQLPEERGSQRTWGLLQASQSGLGAGPQHPPLISRVTWQPKGKLSTPLRSGQIWLEPGTHGDQGCSGQSGIPPPRLAL